MLVELARRHYGVHTFMRDCKLPGSFADYAKPVYDGGGEERGDYKIDEDKLLAALPENFLPVKSNQILLLVGDEMSSTGQLGLKRFRDWAKYFDAYSLTLNIEEDS